MQLYHASSRTGIVQDIEERESISLDDLVKGAKMLDLT
jgi:hypothetical protein